MTLMMLRTPSQTATARRMIMVMQMLYNIFLVLLLLSYQADAFNLIIGGEEVSSGIGGNVGGFDNVRFAFDIGLPEGVIVGQSEVESLICRTQDFLAQVLYNEFQEPSFHVKATGIKWEYLPESSAVQVKFTADVSSNETDVPSPEDIKDSYAGLDMGAYLVDHVQASQCPTGFAQATEATYEVNLTPEEDGDLAEANCQAATTCAPTVTPGSPTSMPTRFPTKRPASTPPPKQAFQSEEEQLRPDHTRSPSVATPKPVSFANPAYLAPVHLTPTIQDGTPSSSGGSNGSGGGGDSSSGGESNGSGSTSGNDGSSSGSNPDGSGASSGEGDSNGASGGSSSSGSNGGDGGGSDGNNGGGGDTGGAGSTESGSSADASGFGTESSDGNGGGTGSDGGTANGGNAGSSTSGSSPTDSGSTSDGTSGGAGSDGINGGSDGGIPGDGAEPGSSAYSSSAPGFGMGGSSDASGGGTSNGSMTFGGNPQGSGSDGGDDSGGSEGNNESGNGDGGESGGGGSGSNSNHSDAETRSSDMVLFNLKFGFFDDEQASGGEESEVKSLVCYTQDFFSSELQILLGDPEISFQAVDVDWKYDGKEFELSFAADVKDGSGAAVPENAVFQALKIAKNDLNEYMLNYVMNVQPPEGQSESIFFSVNEVDLQSLQNAPIPVGRLPQGVEETCDQFQGRGDVGSSGSSSMGNQHEATMSSAQRGMSGLEDSITSEDGTGTSPYEGGILSVDGNEIGSEVQLSVELGLSKDVTKSLEDSEVEACLCEIHKFLEKELRETLSSATLESEVKLVAWSENSNMRVEIVFVLETLPDDGPPVSSAMLYEALKLDNGALEELIEDYIWKTEPSENVFRETTEISFEANIGAPLSSLDQMSPISCPDMADNGAPPDISQLGGFSLPGLPGGAANGGMPSQESPAASPPINEALSMQEVAYNLIMGFYDELPGEPGKEDIAALMCQAKKYFTEYLKSSLQDEDATVSITNIQWFYNEDCVTPINVMFAIGATLGDGTDVSTDEIYSDLRLGDDEILELIQDYIWMSGTPFSNVNQLVFEESMGGDLEVPEGEIPEAICPIEESPSTPMPPMQTAMEASYRLVFGFYEGEAREPTMAEVEGLICQTNAYFEKKLQEVLGDPGLEAQAMNICWSYSPDCPGPVTVTFFFIAILGNGEKVSPDNIFEALKLSEEEAQTYLEEYVWKSAPEQSNLFYNANQVGFDDSLGEPLRGKIDQASCPAEGVSGPSLSRPSSNDESSPGGPPASSASSSESEESLTGHNRKDPFSSNTEETENDANEPAQSPSVPATQNNAVLFHLELGFYEGTVSEPTTSEIEALICESTEFVKAELQGENQEECIAEATLSKIDWTFDENCETAPVTVTYAAQATFCNGTEVAPELIYESLKLDADEIKLYLEAYAWDVGEGNLFYNANAMNFQGKLHTAIRPGKIAEVSC